MSIKKHDEALIKELLKKHVQMGKEKKNYTQEEMVELSDISNSVISRIANNKTLVNIHTLAQLVLSLDIDANKFFAEYGEKSKFFNQDE